MSDVWSPMAPDAYGNLRVAGGDARLYVKFEKRSRRNAYKSEIEGRPIYEPVDYIKIQQPGERDQWIGPATEAHKQRFPHQWRQYAEQTEQTPVGTPVQLLFPNEPHIVELLLDLKIQTIEQLGALTEHGIERLGMDGRRYVAKAQSALDRSEAVREVTKLEHTVGLQADEIAVLKQANSELGARITAMERMLRDSQMQAVSDIRAAQLFAGPSLPQPTQQPHGLDYEPPPERIPLA